MGRKYLGGSGESLTVWISLAASTVLVFYGYDQVREADNLSDGLADKTKLREFSVTSLFLKISSRPWVILLSRPKEP